MEEPNRICPKCKQEKLAKVFSKDYRHNPPKRRGPCNTCCNIANLISREKNREQYNKKARERRNARKLRAISYKGGCCARCGGVFHTAAFDFHHLDPNEKEVDPGLMMGATDEVLFKELDKCILLCSNCHRELHYEESNPSTS